MRMKLLIDVDVDEDFSEDFVCLVKESVEKLSPDYITSEYSVEKFDDEDARFVADLLADKCMHRIISIIYSGSDDYEKVNRIMARLNEMSKESTSFAGRNKLIIAKSAISLMNKISGIMCGSDEGVLERLSNYIQEWDNLKEKD